MSKHTQTNISTVSAQHFNARRLLRLALAASAVAGFVSSASAQTGLTFPSFPTGSASQTQSVSQDTASQFTAMAQESHRATASQRIAKLLGMKKQIPARLANPSSPTLALPLFPSNEPARTLSPWSAEPAVASNTHAPTICRSTSGKSECLKTEASSGDVMLASANESLPQAAEPTLVVEESELATGAQVETESLSESLSESLGESLIDIAVPTSFDQSVQDAAPRLPELVKRPPAMQLRIGGNAGRLPTKHAAEQLASASTRFSLSDSDEPLSPKTVVQAANVNPMNVRIEGEPMTVLAVAKPTALALTPVTASPVTATPVAAHKPSVDASQRTVGHKTLSDKGTDRATTMGARLEVDLHESTNVETAQVISGLSVEHPELCQVLKSGERSLSFVGLKAGQTRVALFTTDASGERKIEIREVVIAGSENRLDDMKSLATEIGRSVHSMYPHSQIEVIAEADGLTVQGYAGTEEEAKKIIGLVRRTSLQPVVDRLATYK